MRRLIQYCAENVYGAQISSYTLNHIIHTKEIQSGMHIPATVNQTGVSRETIWKLKFVVSIVNV